MNPRRSPRERSDEDGLPTTLSSGSPSVGAKRIGLATLIGLFFGFLGTFATLFTKSTSLQEKEMYETEIAHLTSLIEGNETLQEIHRKTEEEKMILNELISRRIEIVEEIHDRTEEVSALNSEFSKLELSIKYKREQLETLEDAIDANAEEIGEILFSAAMLVLEELFEQLPSGQENILVENVDERLTEYFGFPITIEQVSKHRKSDFQEKYKLGRRNISKKD